MLAARRSRTSGGAERNPASVLTQPSAGFSRVIAAPRKVAARRRRSRSRARGRSPTIRRRTSPASRCTATGALTLCERTVMSVTDPKSRSADPTEAVVSAPFFYRGEVVAGSEQTHRSRDLGVAFATPRLDLDKAVAPRTEVPPLLNVPVADIID